MIIYTDASLDPNSKNAGLGCAAFDDDHNYMFSSALPCKLNVQHEVQEAEFRSICEALTLIKDADANVIIYNDNTTVVDMIQGKIANPQKQYEHFIKQISLVKNVSVRWICREDNKADALAELALRRKGSKRINPKKLAF